MTMTLENFTGKTKYTSVCRKIEDAIKRNNFRTGHQLPPERKLAESFNVSVMTLRKSLSILEKKGVITREQGVGTFLKTDINQTMENTPVEDSNSVKPRNILHLAVNSVDVNEDYFFYGNRYYHHQITIIESILSKYDRNLLVSNININDIACEKIPKVLNKKNIAGILLDGFVTDFCLYILSKLNISIVVLGNHKLTIPNISVSYNFEALAFSVTEKLFRSNGYPTYLATEPYELEYTHQLLNGYTKACIEMGVEVKPYIFSPSVKPQSVFSQMVKDSQGHFNLFLATNTTYALSEVLMQNNMSFKDCCLVVQGFADSVPIDILKQITFIPGCDSQAPNVAAELIHKLADGHQIQSVCLEPIVKEKLVDDLLQFDIKWQ